MLRHDIPNHYNVLGVARDATPDQIKAAYRRLARQTHPDTLGPNVSAEVYANAEEKFKHLSFAYETLSDLDKRQRYENDLRYYEAGPSHSFEEPDERMRVQWDVNSVYNRLRYDTLWDDFISRPYEWSERSLSFYERWEWLAGAVVIVGIIVHFRYGWTPRLPEPAHDRDPLSDAPIKFGFFGACVGMGLTFLNFLYAVIKHRRTFRRSSHFRWVLLDRTSNMGAILALVSAVIGGLYGYYYG